MHILPMLDAAPTRPQADAPGHIMEGWVQAMTIRERLAMHPTLIGMLDAAMEGRPVSIAAMQPYLPGKDDCQAQVSHGWDDTFEGIRCWSAEEMLWCTLRDWYGWGIITQEGVQAIQRLAPEGLIEFGQGSGYNRRVLEACAVPTVTAECFGRGYRTLGLWQAPDVDDGIDLCMQDTRPILIVWPDAAADFSWLASLTPGRLVLETGGEGVCGITPRKMAAWGYTCIESTESAFASCSGNTTPLRVWQRTA